MATVTRESLSFLALVLAPEQLDEIARYSGRAAEIVNTVVQHTVQQSTQTALLTQQKEKQAAEYEREAARLEELHEISGTKKQKLTPEGQASIALLAQIASTWGLNNAQASSIVAASAQESLQISKVKSQQLTNRRQELQIKQTSELVAQKIQLLKHVHESKVAEHAATKPKAQQQQAQSRLHASKIKGYKQTQRSHEAQLAENGYDNSLKHSEILKLDREVKAAMLKEEAKEKLLQSYLGLPPDLPVARLMVEQAQQALEQRREEYANIIMTER